jgi:hypothetical protein
MRAVMMRETDLRVLSGGPRGSSAELAQRALPSATSAQRADVAVPGRQVGAAKTSSDDLLDLYRALAEADDLNDAVALARIGWQFYSMACSAHQARNEAAYLVGELCAAARAAVAGHGSPASLALLREVLARHGWLPPPGATPLQMIAAPRPGSCC